MDAHMNASLGKLWHPYTKHSDAEQGFPTIVRGEGAYLYDEDGIRYLDAISSWWACNLGHSHPRLTAAITRQAAELQHSILGGLSHSPAVELSSRLASMFSDDRRVFFASDGASAVEAALKIAVQYRQNIGQSERNGFASLQNAYHGDTLGAVSVGYMEEFHKPFEGLLFPVRRAEAPCCATCSWGKKPDECNAECFGSMSALLAEHHPELTAVIVEPLCQGAAGMRIYAPKYLKKLADACREYDILLIADEIAVGMGRTGRMFAFEHAGIDPDIICVGKGLSGGTLPLSATVVRSGIYDTFSDSPEDHTFYHGHTFGGNPIACAAALETLAVYEEESVVRQAGELGVLLAEEFNKLVALPGVVGVRHLGMIAALEVDDPHAVRRRMWADRILVRPLGKVVYLMLPLIVDEAVVSDTVGQLAKAIGNCVPR